LVISSCLYADAEGAISKKLPPPRPPPKAEDTRRKQKDTLVACVGRSSLPLSMSFTHYAPEQEVAIHQYRYRLDSKQQSVTSTIHHIAVFY